MNQTLKDVLALAVIQDPKIMVSKDEIEISLGEDTRYLETLGLTKRHLIRLERLGLAVKARYATENKNPRHSKFLPENRPTGPHRNRWILIREIS